MQKVESEGFVYNGDNWGEVLLCLGKLAVFYTSWANLKRVSFWRGDVYRGNLGSTAIWGTRHIWQQHPLKQGFG